MAQEKVKDKRTKTPFQRKYKRTYNATWEVRRRELICFRAARRTTSLV